MRTGEIVHGFRIKSQRELKEIPAVLWEMEHEKTGAQLVWLDRADENKTFSIAFKTIPEDSTGVFHILEHSVLCGSDKYPVKEPFVELLKSSVQTFLNAMTFPDKTVYPVSSRNDQDLMNLMDIYLDAVFHPAIYHKPEIFRQEGWRYETGETASYQGVVLNEMKGAFSSPAEVKETAMSRLMFPDTCYRHVSGGDPAHIMDLTYEQFIATHQKYYHPSNALISLVGSVRIDEMLARIDQVLAPYDRREADFTIPVQAPHPAVREEVAYEIGAEEPLEGRTIVSCGTLLGMYDDRLKECAARVLCDYLAGDNEAPLKKAILSAGLGQDVTVSVDGGIQQSAISWSVWNTDRDKIQAIEDTVRQVLTGLAEGGLDQRRLRACFNARAFRMRDMDALPYPRSLGEAIFMLDTWLYGGDPAQSLLVEDVLQSLEERLNTGYFEDLIRELFLDNASTVTAVLCPSHTLGEERGKAEAERLSAEMAAWTEETKAAKAREAEALAAWQQTPDSPEALSTIPMLKLSDLKDSLSPLPVTVNQWKNTPLMRHSTGSSLRYVRCHFDVNDLTLEEAAELSQMCALLGKMGTRHHSSEEIQMLIKEKIGRLSFSLQEFNGEGNEDCRLMLTAAMVCLPGEMDGAADILKEIMCDTLFDNRKLLKETIDRINLGLQMNLANAGHALALTRAMAGVSGIGAVQEYLSGPSAVMRLKKLADASDAELDAILARFEALSQRVFTVARMTLSCSDNVDESVFERLGLPEGQAVPTAARFGSAGARQEGFVIPAAVGFAAMAANLNRSGRPFDGSMYVLAGVLNYMYLWSEIRVQGGAYGCGFMARPSGEAGYYTFRDPKPGRSLEIMKNAPAFLKEFCSQAPDLTGFILSASTVMDPLRNVEEVISEAEELYFRGIDQAILNERYRQLIRTTPESLMALIPCLEAIGQENNLCVVAGKDLMDACSDQVKDIRAL